MWTLFSADTWSVVFTGLVVVFIALVGLVVLLFISGKIFNSINKNKNNIIETDDTDDEIMPITQEILPTETELLEDEEDEGVIVAITAAIATLFSAQGNNNQFVIKSVRRKKDTKNAWNNASITENTRPF